MINWKYIDASEVDKLYTENEIKYIVTSGGERYEVIATHPTQMIYQVKIVGE